MSGHGSNFDQIEEEPYLSTWSSGFEQTGDEELMDYDSLIKLRLMSGKLLKNSSIARALLLAKKSSIIGGTISVQVNAPESYQSDIEDLLEEEYKGIDINKEFSLQEMLEQVITGAFDKGDILINLPTDKTRVPITTYVELIEASRILTPHEFSDDPLVRNGVVFSKAGKTLGYWVKKVHTSKLNRISSFSRIDKKENFDFFPVFIGGRRVSYLFKAPTALRPNMARQFPMLTQCMEDIRLLEKYVKAVVIGAQVGACHAGFITTANSGGAKKSTESGSSSSRPQNVGKIQPGTINYLRRGDSIDFSSPSRPADNTEPFIKRMLINCAASVRTAYEIAFMHLEDVNLSSWKGGIIEARRDGKLWVNGLSWICDWISRTIILEAITNGTIKGSLKNVKITTHFPRYDPLDDEKSARGDNISLNKNKTTSKHIVCGENNIDYDKMMVDRKIEAIDEVEAEADILERKKELEKEKGIIFPEASPSTLEGEAEQRDTSGSRREGEEGGSDLDEEDARDRRKEDGNL